MYDINYRTYMGMCVCFVTFFCRSQNFEERQTKLVETPRTGKRWSFQHPRRRFRLHTPNPPVAAPLTVSMAAQQRWRRRMESHPDPCHDDIFSAFSPPPPGVCVCVTKRPSIAPPPPVYVDQHAHTPNICCHITISTNLAHAAEGRYIQARNNPPLFHQM